MRSADSAVNHHATYTDGIPVRATCERSSMSAPIISACRFRNGGYATGHTNHALLSTQFAPNIRDEANKCATTVVRAAKDVFCHTSKGDMLIMVSLIVHR